MKRPGVATTTSTPARRSWRCSCIATPPTTITLRAERPDVRLNARTWSWKRAGKWSGRER